MSTIHVDIVSAEGDIHHGEAAMVFAPAEMGEVGIAPRHAPLLTRLKAGTVRVKQPDGEELAFFVGGGILEVQPQLVTVLADTALRARDADEAAALDAKRRAEEKLASASGDIDLARAQAELAQAAALVAFLKKVKRGR
ncbi:MAG: F0F1 ATP synthase subunit epsilon [Gammaproteobacteria bacterium]|nr:F0F1 ATP synthase subunit epsilon [Gammaproteobacteria bacterium]